MKEFLGSEIFKIILEASEGDKDPPQMLQGESTLLDQKTFTGLNTLTDATPSEIAFYFSRHYEEEVKNTHAGLVVSGHAFIASLSLKSAAQNGALVVTCRSPYKVMAKLTEFFSRYQSVEDHTQKFSQSEIHETAVIHPSAVLNHPVKIGANVVIEKGAVIGAQSVIYPHCYLGEGVTVGEGTVLFPRVVLYAHTQIGENCRIHAGVVLGADGFGYATEAKTQNEATEIVHHKIYHLGRVEIGNSVEIGANTTIDRGTLGKTLISDHVKIDNLVQIGHNCKIGEGTLICGCAGMSGSSSTGRYVVVGAQSGTANQVHVGDYAKLAAYTGAAKDVPEKAEMGGVPARNLSDYYRILALQNKLLKERS